jgi:hypothetical protein
MPTLANFTQFDGRYWDTASIRNALDYQGVRAPHTSEPYTEAMLMGISGGVTFGYFTFHYDGYDPQVNLLTRNTFEPVDKIFGRMGIACEVLQTTSADKGRKNLIEAIEDGHAPIVFPDMWSLSYNAMPYDEGMWGGLPVVVYGYEPEKGEAYISDRSFVSLTVTTDELDVARARVKKDKHRLLILEHPDESLLVSAVRQGIHDCINLMTEKPPRGSSKNFGLSGLLHWGEMLQKTTKGSWAREYPTGRPLMSVLVSAYTFLGPAFGKTMKAERDVYADFLDEAVNVLQMSELENVAVRYRLAGDAWDGLLCALLPEDVPLLKKAREYINMKHEYFIEKGVGATDEMMDCTTKLNALKIEAEHNFSMTEAEVSDLRDELYRHVKMVHEAEEEAIMALKSVMT